MTLLEHLLRMTRFGMWADAGLLATLKSSDAAKLPQRCTNLFAHMQAARAMWMSRMDGSPTAGIELFPEASVADCEALLARANEQWAKLAPTLNDAEIERVLEFANTKGDRFATPLRDALIQLCDHGSYHRAQIIASLKEASLDIPSPPPNFLVYIRTQE